MSGGGFFEDNDDVDGDDDDHANCHHLGHLDQEEPPPTPGARASSSPSSLKHTGDGACPYTTLDAGHCSVSSAHPLSFKDYSFITTILSKLIL